MAGRRAESFWTQSDALFRCWQRSLHSDRGCVQREVTTCLRWLRRLSLDDPDDDAMRDVLSETAVELLIAALIGD